MNSAEIQYILDNPFASADDLAKHYLSNPQYLEEWLRNKGKALAGISHDCTQCVIATYLSERLTENKLEFERIEICITHAEIFTEWEELCVRLPRWTQRFIVAIDEHRNSKGKPVYPYTSKCRIFSGNLAANILKVTLESGVQ